MLNPLKLWAACIGIAQLGLLVVTYRSHQQTSLISTDLLAFPQFNIWLSMTVIAQIITSGLYMASLRHRCLPAFYAAMLACVGALVGWSLLSAYSLETYTHSDGTCIFAASSCLYSLLMLIMTYLDERKQFIAIPAISVFVVLYTLTAGLMLGFFIEYSDGNMAIAATFEWAAFMSQAAIFTLFFATHSFAESRGSLGVIELHAARYCIVPV